VNLGAPILKDLSEDSTSPPRAACEIISSAKALYGGQRVALLVRQHQEQACCAAISLMIWDRSLERFTQSRRVSTSKKIADLDFVRAGSKGD
jgi:hypothetical protein